MKYVFWPKEEIDLKGLRTEQAIDKLEGECDKLFANIQENFLDVKVVQKIRIARAVVLELESAEEAEKIAKRCGCNFKETALRKIE